MELRAEAERYLGAAIMQEEFEKAKEDAERKLRWIISREGDAGGARKEPWYLAQLIAEAVRASRLTTYCIVQYELRKLAEAMDIEAKEKPTAQAAGNSPKCLYCTRKTLEMQ